MIERSRIRDEVLVLQSRAGDRTAFQELVTRWQERIWRHARRLVGRDDAAWDVVQETWVVVAAKIATLEDAERFRSWLFAIATHKAASHQRERGRHERHIETNDVPDSVPHGSSESDPADRVRRALRRLSPERQVLLALRYVEDFTVPEIARAMNLPLGTVKSRLHHAHKELVSLLERIEP
ncbi:MAG: RNA polymerase sigma factor [Planctomycetes bacterium]|nr:RNA polymerase sigma factor [Planctomycetota bacterium]